MKVVISSLAFLLLVFSGCGSGNNCTPDCTGKVCGPDPVCGESCGTCTGGETCDAQGQCVSSCTPSCAGRECGWDPVCGTMDCGNCSGGETCDAQGQCVSSCTPSCAGRECGWDPVCGTMDCGTCTGGETCNEQGQCATECTPSCTGRECGPDGCGGNCSTGCSGNETCNTTTGQCVCNPNCTGKECGPDGCGGNCSTGCSGNETCNTTTGQCVCNPACTGKECGPDGCGGTCSPGCSGNETCQDGVCVLTCDNTTCSLGCCSGNMCMPGNSIGACGIDGNQCDICTGGDTCVSGTCATPVDPCNGVPVEGQCTSNTTYDKCVVPSGDGEPYVITYSCPQGYECQIVNDFAECVLVAECIEGTQLCYNETIISVCENGLWAYYLCPGSCNSTPLGDYCPPDVDVVPYTITISYEAKAPNAGFTDWGDPWPASAQGFLVLTQDSTGTLLYDARITDSDGQVTLNVPTVPSANDYFVIMAAGLRSDGELSFVVADPNFSLGEHNISEDPADPYVWSWAGRIQDFPTGSSVLIPTESGSGAARVFDYLRYVYAISEYRWPSIQPQPLIVWLGMGVNWSCGACFGCWQPQTMKFGMDFKSQIWMPGGANEQYWADGVTAHELGHWGMWTYGMSSREGGGHCIGIPTLPGQGWSEGWATWFSCDAREDPLYVDKQGGMFWINIDLRQYSSGFPPWQRPDTFEGFFQMIDENEVSSMMWNISHIQGLTRSPLDLALASPRMKEWPFDGRGYFHHTWEMDGCTKINISEDWYSVPMFADFLDTLICNGVSQYVVDSATDPKTYYPYPSDNPICDNPKMPVVISLTADSDPDSDNNLSIKLGIKRKGYWPIPIRIDVRVPDGIAVLNGLMSTIIPANFEPDHVEIYYELEARRIPEKDLVVILDSRNEGAGFHAEVPYRFGRPTPQVVAPIKNGPRIIIGQKDLGKAIQLPK